MKIKKGVFILVECFLSVRFVFGQNLVNNRDFQLSIYPTGLSQITKGDYWSSPSDGTPDLYKDCTIFGVDEPRNSQGWCFLPDSTADTMSVAPSGIFGFYYLENVSLFRDSVTNIDGPEKKFANSVVHIILGLILR
ncbi:MAG: hypothetical protein ACO1G9_12700 [Bacteroidota bacterium]